MIEEGGVDARRSRPAYRAGVWMFGLSDEVRANRKLVWRDVFGR